MSNLDDHCIITKYEMTEKEKELKNAFFKGDNKNKNTKQASNNLQFQGNKNMIGKKIQN